MKRRRFIGTLTAGGLGAVSVGCAAEQDAGAPNIQTNPRVQWRLASSFARSLDTIYGAADVLANRVSEATGGRFTIRVHPGGEIVPALEVLGAVQNGTVPMGHTASYYFRGKNPALAFDTGVPFGLTARQHNAWLYHGEGKDLMASLFADFNIVNLPGGNTGVQMGGWFRRRVDGLDDLRGLKMRIPGIGGDVMDRLGVSVQLIPGGEIYQALERGTIDATEWVGPYDDEKLGLNRIADYYYYPGWWEPGAGLSFYVNRTAWDRLPATYRHILTAAAAEASVGMQARYDAENPGAFRRLVEGGTDVRPFSDDIMQAAETAARDIMAELAGRDPAYARIHASYMGFRDDANRWFATAEHAMAAHAFRGSNA